LELAEDDDTDLPDVEVQCDAQRAVLEFQQLVCLRRGEAFDVGDPVAGVGDDTDLFTRDLGRVRRDVALESTPDLIGGDGQLGHLGFLTSGRTVSYRGTRTRRGTGQIMTDPRGRFGRR